MGEGKKLEKHEARVEFYAVEAEVVDLIERGYGYTMIYKKFLQEKKVTMSYVTFYGYISKRINKKDVRKKKNQLQERKVENQPVAALEKSSIYIEKDPDKQKKEFM